jgi:hypothetical protein
LGPALSGWLSVPTVACQSCCSSSCCSSAAISRSLLSCSRAWCWQNRSSPPEASTARTRAAAPQRSHRSAAVNSGRASAVVIGVLPPSRHRNSRCHFRPRSRSEEVRSCSLVPLLQTLGGAQVFPRRCDSRHARVYPDVAAFRTSSVSLCSRHQGICHQKPWSIRDVDHYYGSCCPGSPSANRPVNWLPEGSAGRIGATLRFYLPGTQHVGRRIETTGVTRSRSRRGPQTTSSPRPIGRGDDEELTGVPAQSR